MAAGWIVVVPPDALARPTEPVGVPGLPSTGVLVAIHAEEPRLKIVPCADGAPNPASNRADSPVPVGSAWEPLALPQA